MKYNNVCVSDGGNGIVATIIELGLMKSIGTERVTRKKRYPHALPWVALELVKETCSNSEKSDAYSLAFMMYAMMIMKTNCVSRKVDEGLIMWIEAALKDDPAKRSTLTVLVELLEGILEDASKRDSRSGDALSNLRNRPNHRP